MPIVNAPTAPNTGGFESKVTPTVGAGRESTDTKGQNLNSAGNLFEQRCQQEAGHTRVPLTVAGGWFTSGSPLRARHAGAVRGCSAATA